MVLNIEGLQLRGDSAANWKKANPVLKARELGIETDTLKIKIGDGVKSWAQLSYVVDDTALLHKTKDETKSGVLTLTGGNGGSNPGLKITNGAVAGSYTTTMWTGFATHRLVNNKIHTGSFYINSDGSVIYRHKTGSASVEGNANDAVLTLHPVNGIMAGFGGAEGKAAESHPVLLDEINYDGLKTSNKTIIGAINELYDLVKG